MLLKYFTKIPTTGLCKALIERTLHDKNALELIPNETRIKLASILSDVNIYAEVSNIMNFETWPQAYDFSMKTPNTIFEKLLYMELTDLCYEWSKVVKLPTAFPQYKKLFMQTILTNMMKLNDIYVSEQQQQQQLNDGSISICSLNIEMDYYLIQIFEMFNVQDCVELLNSNKDKFKSRAMLRYAIDFLCKHTLNPAIYTNYKISLIIFDQLTAMEIESFWKLVKYPLLILEQMLMNSKFEMLSKILPLVQKSLSSEDHRICSYCFDKRGHLYDVHHKSSQHDSPQRLNFQLGGDGNQAALNSAFILLNFNLYQHDHFITNECIDLLLRIYATKALDYHISHTSFSSSEHISTDQSLDSLCGAFRMPKNAPQRDDWIRDEEATVCMCCRRAAFTMLIRRHHCRRCGRVVCFACSTHRMRIPEIYADIEVRICNDCHQQIEELQIQNKKEHKENSPTQKKRKKISGQIYKWNLSGNITHDKLLREEFSYEHSPSVALSLSILEFHLGKQKCVELLTYHCRKLEKLMVPNPEVDFELITKMINCLAIAAGVSK